MLDIACDASGKEHLNNSRIYNDVILLISEINATIEGRTECVISDIIIVR